jgi:hypothetical protein
MASASGREERILMKAALLLALSILAAGALIAAALTGRLSGDLGTRLHRECESIARMVPNFLDRSGVDLEDFVESCIWRRAGPASARGE